MRSKSDVALCRQEGGRGWEIALCRHQRAMGVLLAACMSDEALEMGWRGVEMAGRGWGGVERKQSGDQV